MEKTFYVSLGYAGGRRGLADKVIPVCCTEENLKMVATAIGRGYGADSCTVSTTDSDARDSFIRPYMVLWDCM